MSPGVQRFAGAVGAVAVSAAVNVATGLFTARAAVVWWVTGIVLLVVGVAIQWWLPISDPHVPPREQIATGNKVGGSLNQSLHGPGSQTASDNKITGDLTQAQDG